MRNHRDHDRRLLGFAREMRAESTDAERRLWRILRSRRLADYKFRRQYPIEGYIVDFICLAEGLVVESDGGQHSAPAAKAYDDRRTAQLAKLGIEVIRFWDHDVLKHSREVAEAIYRALTRGEPSPQPSPGVPGEGAGGHRADHGESA